MLEQLRESDFTLPANKVSERKEKSRAASFSLSFCLHEITLYMCRSIRILRVNEQNVHGMPSQIIVG